MRLASCVLNFMLRINQNQQSGTVKGYYTSDYYVGAGQELTGRWHGKGAERLGLSGDIAKADWDALCDGINPQSGERLMQRLKENRTVCYDFNFHAPKSVSVLYAATRDERLLDAFRESVRETMAAIEVEMQTRVRKGGRNEDRVTGNMTWGEHVHFTSRPVDGTPDPHLHVHAVVFNATFDPQEDKWKAGQFRHLVRDAPCFSALFHSALSLKLADLGLPVERTRHGWELGGVPRSLVDKFSRRTAQIEKAARDKGIDDPKAKAELGAKTRNRKAKDLTMPELQREWRGRMSVEEFAIVDRLERMIGGDAAPRDGGAARSAVEFAVSHEFERRSVVPERKLLAAAMMHAVGQAAPGEVKVALERSSVIIGAHNGRRMATTREVLNVERRIVDEAKGGRGAVAPLAKPGEVQLPEWLSTAQQAGVRHVLESRDRFCVVVGQAGTGKTTLAKAAADAARARGTNVVGLAPTAEATEVLRQAGFEAHTVAMLLKSPRLQRQAKDKLLWLDEASLLAAKDAASLFTLVRKLDCRCVVMGDPKQHAAVARGNVMELLLEEAGLRAAHVRDIRRQAGAYKQAIQALSQGRVSEGFKRIDALGWIKEIPDADRFRQLAAEYVDTIASGKTCLVVCPTHREGDQVAATIRAALKDRGMIGGEQRNFTVLQNAHLTEAERRDLQSYRPGQVLQFHQNAKGYMKGQRAAVDGRALPLDQADRFSVYDTRRLELAAGDVVRITHNGLTADRKHKLVNGSMHRIEGFTNSGDIILDNGWRVPHSFGHLAHGVCTSYGSQGKSVDVVLVAQGSDSYAASNSEQFYVSCSRGKQAVRLYCQSKAALKEAIMQSQERLTASELIEADRRRERARRADHAKMAPAAQREERGRELVHER